jgi:hypothetical protein
MPPRSRPAAEDQWMGWSWSCKNTRARLCPRGFGAAACRPVCLFALSEGAQCVHSRGSAWIRVCEVLMDSLFAIESGCLWMYPYLRSSFTIQCSPHLPILHSRRPSSQFSVFQFYSFRIFPSLSGHPAPPTLIIPPLVATLHLLCPDFPHLSLYSSYILYIPHLRMFSQLYRSTIMYTSAPYT